MTPSVGRHASPGDRQGWQEEAGDLPPVVLVGAGITALGATRCLARRGLEVLHLAGPDPGLLGSSRWFRPLVSERTTADLSPGAPGLSRTLAYVLREEAPVTSVLIPCSDDAVRAVAGLPDELRGPHRTSLSDPSTLELLLSKASLADALDRSEVAHPLTARIAGRRDLERLPGSALSRSLLKPVDSQSFFARFGVKAFAVENRWDAEAALDRCSAAGLDVVLQEWVPGPPTNHYFVDGFRARDGETKGILVRRRLRMEPPDFGNSSAMTTVDEDEARPAVDALERLLDDVGYRGIFSAEFKRDARDDEFRLLEVNVRPWWYVEFAARCGLDVCAMAYRDALGLSVARIDHVEVGRRCVYPYYDVFAAWREVRAGDLSPIAWTRSWIGAAYPVFAVDDPRPALAGLGRRLVGGLRRRLS